MRSVRRLFGAAALLAAFGLLALVGTGGSSRAEEKGNEKETPKLTEAGQTVKDIATAYDLIEYGRRKKDPKPLCVGVQMLLTLDEGDEGGDLKVDGAKTEEAPKKKELLQKVLNEAKKFDTATNATNKKLIEDTEAEVKNAPGTRASPDGPWSKTIIVQVTDKASDSPVASVSRKFLGGQKAVVSWSDINNKNVPVDVRVVDPSGNVIQHDLGKNGRLEWFVFGKDTTYKIQIRDFHTVACTIKLCTN